MPKAREYRHPFHVHVQRDTAHTGAVLVLTGYIWPDNSNASAVIAEQLAHIKGEELTVFIRNLYGGDTDEGMTIYHDLKALRPKVKIDGVCASMGSVIALAGEHIQMSKHSKWMSHRPQGGTHGDFEDMRERADRNEAIYKEVSAVYAERLGVTSDEAAALLMPKHKEVWLSAAKAKEMGLVDEVTDGSLLSGTVALKELRKEHDPESILDRFHMVSGTTDTDTNEDPMNKELAKKLGLAETATEQEVATALDAVLKERDTAVARLGTMEKAEAERDEAELKELLEEAVKSDTMTVAKRDEVLALAKDNMAMGLKMARTMVSGMKPHQPLSQQLNRDSAAAKKLAAREDWDYDRWATEDPVGLAALKSKDKAAFEQLRKNRPSRR